MNLFGQTLFFFGGGVLIDKLNGKTKKDTDNRQSSPLNPNETRQPTIGIPN